MEKTSANRACSISMLAFLRYVFLHISTIRVYHGNEMQRCNTCSWPPPDICTRQEIHITISYILCEPPSFELIYEPIQLSIIFQNCIQLYIHHNHQLIVHNQHLSQFLTNLPSGKHIQKLLKIAPVEIFDLPIQVQIDQLPALYS